jgi:hypothetical protein
MTFISFHFKAFETKKKQTEEVKLIPEGSDQVYQLLAHCRWFSPASSTTNTGLHDITEILLKVA